MLNLKDYEYSLPKKLIAQHPVDKKDNCKLLIWKDGNIIDKLFFEIDNFIDKNSIIFFNNTKVIKSRIVLENINIIDNNKTEKKIKKGEIFFLKKINNKLFEGLVYPGKKLKIGSKFRLYDIQFEIIQNTNEGRIISIDSNIETFLNKYGQMPLPPYINYSKEKEKSYQSIFAQNPGSTAAPTASLHFTNNLLSKLKNKGVTFEYATLHIGLGTFKLVNVDNIKDYKIHSENIEIDNEIFNKIQYYKNQNKSIIATGTTITRTLESLPFLRKVLNYGNLPYREKITNNINENESKLIIDNINILGNKINFDSNLYLYPGKEFKIIDKLITNFHLPKSSLLMLVAGFMGYDNMMKCYFHAIKNDYRFFSFGDAMFINIK